MTDFLEQLRAALADRYAIERELGRGGMATVYLALDLRHKRRVALKVLDPELGVVVGGERFRREIEMAAELQHPHVLPVFDSGEVASTSAAGGRWLWYTMPYVQGESLRDRLRREHQLPISDALRIAREVADALDYAHRNGVVHRDIKPGNILLSEGHALVADFGIARQAEKAPTDVAESATSATLTGTGISLGTPAYMSPEQALGARDIDGRSDQYALGCMLYEILAGVPPYTGRSAQAVIGQHVTAPPPDLRAARSEVPLAVAAAVAKAMAKTPEERFATAAEFGTALEGAGAASITRVSIRQRTRRGLLIVVIVVLAAATTLGMAALLRRSGSASALDGHLVAVAPFEVLVPELAVWREGMVDYISRSLDGAGSLRTVPPTTILRRWRGRADRASAAALGRRTGAGLVLYGQLLRIGRDSVRVVATLMDAQRGTVIAEVNGVDDAERVDRAADAVAVDILRQAGSSQRLGRGVQGRLGSRSPVAVRAFLRGEQFYRGGMIDSAIARYKEAIEADSNFTLAQWHLGRVLGWHGLEDPNQFLLWAAAHARGLAPRDSVLITADSIVAALATSPVPLGISPVTRLLALLEGAAQRDPSDPEVWFQLGEARVHWGGAVGVALEDALRAFQQSIALDSLFVPAYIHCVELELQEQDPAAALRYFDRAHALGAEAAAGTTVRAQRYLLRAAVTGAPVDEDSVTTGDLRFTLTNVFLWWPDSGATTVSMVRALIRKSHTDPFSQAEEDSSQAAQELAHRGHLAEAAQLAGNNLWILLELALLGAVPAERIERVLRASSAARDGLPLDASLWWGARGDTAALRRIAAHGERRGVDPVDAVAARLNASAQLALARHDTTTALRALTSLTDSLSTGYSAGLLERARLLAATGKLDEARRQYIRTGRGDRPLSVMARLELGERAERQGARQLALDSYQFVTAIWKHADPVLQPYMTRARAGLARLTSESRPPS